jgi:uncharacterized protein YabN with tetrapyrrole methylase and pyrophosphatase domain
MRTLVIAGLGPGGAGQLTAEAREVLERAAGAGRLLLRTRVHPTVDAWPALRAAPALDHLYEEDADFDAVYDGIARAVLDAVQAHPHVDTETLIGAAGARLGCGVTPGCVRRAARPDR